VSETPETTEDGSVAETTEDTSPPEANGDGSVPKAMTVDAKLGLDVFKLDDEPHIEVDHEVCRAVCAKKVCLTVCPADLYELDDEGGVTVNWEGCLECGTCLLCCEPEALSWKYPRGEYGVQYRTS